MKRAKSHFFWSCAPSIFSSYDQPNQVSFQHWKKLLELTASSNKSWCVFGGLGQLCPWTWARGSPVLSHWLWPSLSPVFTAGPPWCITRAGYGICGAKCKIKISVLQKSAVKETYKDRFSFFHWSLSLSLPPPSLSSPPPHHFLSPSNLSWCFHLLFHVVPSFKLLACILHSPSRCAMPAVNVNTGALSSYAQSPKLHNLHVVAQSLELARQERQNTSQTPRGERKEERIPPQAWSQPRERWVWRSGWECGRVLSHSRGAGESYLKEYRSPGKLSIHGRPSLPVPTCVEDI